MSLGGLREIEGVKCWAKWEIVRIYCTFRGLAVTWVIQVGPKNIIFMSYLLFLLAGALLKFRLVANFLIGL